ncbi:acyl-activating enzyme 1 [Populus alba x Populus x berolinensis]|nr:acyl-activating enzyme 1 [Populus alba x Populus x berolinensis]
MVVALAPNVPALYELHFGVPMAGAVLCALNTRLDASTLALTLEQLNAKLIFVDYQFNDVALKALDLLSLKSVKPPHLVGIPECDKSTSSMDCKNISCDLDYNGLLEMGRDDFTIIRPNKECDPISVNYTSGSTGKPKGVIYSHRAAYLNSLAEIFRFDMRQMPVFLWTVDMFRCNGWCLTWQWLLLVTHFCGPPAILNTIANAPAGNQNPLPFNVNVIIAGPFPYSEILTKVEGLGFNVYHGYGMTEALGPAIVRPWKPELDSTFENEQEKIRNREGLHNLLLEGVDVKDPNTMKSVPYDGKTIGEVMFRSNILMSGGEAISTLEVEAVLLSHPKVSEAAVVGQPDALLNEVPCALVKVKEGFGATAEEITNFCGNRLPDHMIPKSIFLGIYQSISLERCKNLL